MQMKIEETISYRGVILINLFTVLIFYGWYVYFKPVENYELLSRSRTAKGSITSIKEFIDVVDISEKDSKPYHYFEFEYEFKTRDGGKYFAKDEGSGAIPEELLNVDREPYPIDINYAESNPANSRIFKYSNGPDSFYYWLIGCSLSALFLIYWWSAIVYRIVNPPKEEKKLYQTSSSFI